MRDEYFFGFTISSAVGVALETFLGFGYAFSILCIFLALVFLFFRDKTTEIKHGLLVSVIFLGCALGAWRVDVSNANRNMHVLDSFLGRSAQVVGIVADEPDVRETGTNIVLKAKSINGKTTSAANILVHAPAYPVIRYGDEVSVTGKITTPKNFPATPGERAFDYRAYLAKDDIYYEMSFSNIFVTGHNKGNYVLEKLLDLKQGLMSNIARVIPEPESSLAGGIVLGTKQSLGKEWIQKFRDAGLAHIVVLSGYNIAVVASVIGRALSFLPFGARLGSSAIGIVLFALMVGGGATVLRATLMALVVILARAMGRESEALRVLIFVGWVMVLMNPLILFYDVSFQLSFMAALALVLLAGPLEKYFLFIRSGVLREILVTTIATQIFVAPILLYQMGTFSIVGIVANLFVLPVVPPAMFLVALVAVTAPVPFLGMIIAFPAQLILTYMLFIVELGARVPFANVHVASFGIIALTVLYGIIFFACRTLRQAQTATPQTKK